LQLLINADQKIDHRLRASVDGLEQRGDLRSRGPHRQEWSQFVLQPSLIPEGKLFGVRLQEEVERIDDGQLRHQVHLHREVPHALRKNHSRQIIAMRVLLPV
jgi:hypothetical protein